MIIDVRDRSGGQKEGGWIASHNHINLQGSKVSLFFYVIPKLVFLEREFILGTFGLKLRRDWCMKRLKRAAVLIFQAIITLYNNPKWFIHKQPDIIVKRGMDG